MAKNTLVDFYQVNADPNQAITLTVTIGYGQIAATSVMLNHLKAGDYENSFKVALGTSGSLTGKDLLFTTVVHDINPDTDHTSVTVELTGGSIPYKSVMDSTVSQSGDIATYAVDIEFYS